MKEYQQKVLIEQNELAEKIISLTKFMTNQKKVINITNKEFEQLNTQLEAMLEYNIVLLCRIKDFEE